MLPADVQPFPNYYSIGADIRYYLAHGVRGMYQEGNGHGPGSDLDALKSYIVMSAMYDPSQDDATLIADFLSSYFGKAAPFIRLYSESRLFQLPWQLCSFLKLGGRCSQWTRCTEQ